MPDSIVYPSIVEVEPNIDLFIFYLTVFNLNVSDNDKSWLLRLSFSILVGELLVMASVPT
jgi:hypothetical protein